MNAMMRDSLPHDGLSSDQAAAWRDYIERAFDDPQIIRAFETFCGEKQPVLSAPFNQSDIARRLEWCKRMRSWLCAAYGWHNCPAWVRPLN